VRLLCVTCNFFHFCNTLPPFYFDEQPNRIWLLIFLLSQGWQLRAQWRGTAIAQPLNTSFHFAQPPKYGAYAISKLINIYG
jgi:hypothetical protein